MIVATVGFIAKSASVIKSEGKGGEENKGASGGALQASLAHETLETRGLPLALSQAVLVTVAGARIGEGNQDRPAGRSSAIAGLAVRDAAFLAQLAARHDCLALAKVFSAHSAPYASNLYLQPTGIQ